VFGLHDQPEVEVEVPLNMSSFFPADSNVVAADAFAPVRRHAVVITRDAVAEKLAFGLLGWFQQHGSIEYMLERQLLFRTLRADDHYYSMLPMARQLDALFRSVRPEARVSLCRSEVVRSIAAQFYYHYSTVTIGKGKAVFASFLSASPRSNVEQPLPPDMLAEMIRQSALTASNLKKLTGNTNPAGRGRGRGYANVDAGSAGADNNNNAYHHNGRGRGRGRGRGYHNNNYSNNHFENNNNNNNGYNNNNHNNNNAGANNNNNAGGTWSSPLLPTPAPQQGGGGGRGRGNGKQ
jgi:hypothetical protein